MLTQERQILYVIIRTWTLKTEKSKYNERETDS